MALLFNADPSDPAFFEQWAGVSPVPEAFKILPDVKGRPAVRITVDDSYTDLPKMNPHNPAAGFNSKWLFKNGDDVYVRWSILFPDRFPQVVSWLGLGEIYGPPYNGAPCLGLAMRSNQLIGWCRDATHHYDEPWGVPADKGIWHDIVFHVKFSPDPTVGFVEIWHDGVQQPLSPSGAMRRAGATLIPGISWSSPYGRNSLYAYLYFRKGDYTAPVTVLHGRTAVATTLEEVI